MPHSISRQIVEYRAAINADREAKAHARAIALDAPLPFSTSRLHELCDLSDHVTETAARLRSAARNLDVLLQ